MNEKMSESLSALMDDEANELEIERVLAHATSDSELRQTWTRYNLAQQAIAGSSVAFTGVDISKQVRQAITDDVPEQQTATAASSLSSRVLRPLASFGIAASVAATVIVGGQQLASLEGADAFGSNQAVATSASPVGMLNSFGATTVQASYGTQAVPVLQPATRTAYRKLAHQRMERYAQEHAEHAALNSPQGMVTFARVPHIEQ